MAQPTYNLNKTTLFERFRHSRAVHFMLGFVLGHLMMFCICLLVGMILFNNNVQKSSNGNTNTTTLGITSLSVVNISENINSTVQPELMLEKIFEEFTTPTPLTEPSDPLKYYLFGKRSLQYECKLYSTKLKCKPNIPHDLTIHGLWPRSITGIINCPATDGELFELEHLGSDTIAELNKHWQNYAENELLWRQQWNDHGSCTPYDMKSYFDHALQLNQRYPINDWLAQGNIVPNNSMLYNESDIEAALAVHGLKPDQYILNCSHVKVGIKPGDPHKYTIQQWFHSVELCIEYYTNPTAQLAVAICPPTVKSTCIGAFNFIADYTKQTKGFNDHNKTWYRLKKSANKIQ